MQCNCYCCNFPALHALTVLLLLCTQLAASYGRLEMCIRLVEAGSPWPSGKGAKAGGGDVVALLAGSKLCKQRQLKVRVASLFFKCD